MEKQNNQGKLLVQLGVKKMDIKIVTFSKIQYNQGGLYFNKPGHWLCCQIS
jgi:hypothetical protein